MKRLLSILAAVIVGGSPAAITGFQSAGYQSARKITEPAVIDSYSRIVKLLNNKDTTFDEFIVEYRQVPHIIYLIFSEESLNEYMRIVDQMKIRIDALVKTSAQEYLVNEIRLAIENAKKDWQNKVPVNKLASQLTDFIDQEKEASGKLFFAFNQASTQLIMDDMAKYQPIRLANANANAKIGTLKNQKNYYEQLLKEYDRALQWQKNLAGIFNNWIDKARELQEDFMSIARNYFVSPEQFHDFMEKRKEEVINWTAGKLVELVVGKNMADPVSVDEVTDQIINKVKTRVYSPNNQIADWLLQGETSVTGNPEDTKPMTNEQIREKAWTEIQAEIAAAESKNLARALSFSDMVDIASKVVGSVYELDDLMFGQIQTAAEAFFNFVNDQVPSISKDIEQSFKENNIPVVSELDKKMAEITQIIASVSSNILGLFDATGAAGAIVDMAFATVEEVQKWFTTFEVLKRSDEAITVMESVRNRVAKIPDQNALDVLEAKKNLPKIIAELAENEKILAETSAELKNSKYDFLNNNLNIWQSEFKPYLDYLGLDGVLDNIQTNIDFTFPSVDVHLNMIKYWNTQFKTYDQIVEQRKFIFGKLINSPEAQAILGDKLVQFGKDNQILNEINAIALKHREDFNYENIA
ncbi:hypothetical protein [Spiroplasma sp. DGKH1]|uniref:hypothetical protein n=1 Tax=Spiroplasma sp. DGKH1 TaxID=3050074 RepID=UPI0034C64E86